MSERKVLNKYIPKNFDHERIVKRGRGKDKLMIVRNMLPCSLRCNTCSNYLYIGTKFNMRMQICNDEMYLGIKVFRFYLKCTYCYADITFKTDPKNHDYIVETGGTRNYEPVKDAQQAQKLLKKMKVNDKQIDSMRYLQNKTYDSKREMQLAETLDEIKNLNKRQGVIDPQDLLKNIIYLEQQQQKMKEQEEAQIAKEYEQLCERNLQKKMNQLQQNKPAATTVNNQGSYAAIKEQSQEQNYQEKEQKNNKTSNQIDNEKVCNKINKLQTLGAKTVKDTASQSTGKKFVMPVIKSKINNYKKKIIRKEQKAQVNHDQVELQSVTNA